MKKLFLLLVCVILILGVSGVASAVPVPGDYSMPDGVWREYLYGGGPGELGNVLYGHDNGFGDTYDFYWAGPLTLQSVTPIINPTYEYFTVYTGGTLFIDGEVWGEAEDTIYSAPVYANVWTDTAGPQVSFVELFSSFSGYSIYATAIATRTGSDSNSDFGTLTQVSLSVPEPATMFLLGTGLLGLAVAGRKKFFKK